MLERWAKIGCENATVGMNGLIRSTVIFTIAFFVDRLYIVVAINGLQFNFGINLRRALLLDYYCPLS